MGNLHGEFLSSHKSAKAWPGAPDNAYWGRKAIRVEGHLSITVATFGGRIVPRQPGLTVQCRVLSD